MAEIDSTIGKVGRASAPAPDSPQHQQSLDEFLANMPGMPQSVNQPPAPEEPAAKTEEEKPPMQIPTLKSLIELGRVVEDITLGAMTFKMQTLDDETQEQLFKMLSKLDMAGADSFLNLRRAVVAMSIVSVNGRPLESFCEDSNQKETIWMKFAAAKLLQSHVVEVLYNFYNGMLDKGSKSISSEQVKN